MNLSKTRVVIVGAGQAGGRAAEALRAASHIGPITLVGEEAHLPYERTQLSKSILLASEPNPTFIRAPDANIPIVGHPGGVTVNAARDMTVLLGLIASRKRFTGPALKTLI